MKIVFRPSVLHGKITAPPSKSHLHRLLITAAISKGTSVTEGYFSCDDTERTLDCLRKCGVRCSFDKGNLLIEGKSPEKWERNVTLDAGESGATLRLLLPLLLLSGGRKTIFGSEKLFSRPLFLYKTLFESQKIGFELRKDSLTVEGKLQPFDFAPENVVSSQFVSGLLLAMPFLRGSRLRIPKDTQSFPYITLTESVMRSFGFDVLQDENGGKYAFSASGNGLGSKSTVLKDPSGSSFFDALTLLGHDVSLEGLDTQALSQADGVYPKYFAALENGFARLDCADCPDLVPVLTVAAAAKNGAELLHTKRLSYKESDRARVLERELMKFGAEVKVSDDQITVTEAILHKPVSAIDPDGDHRIAMAASVLLTRFGGTLENASCVSKSMPDFFEKLAALGAEFDVISEENE